MISSSSYKAWVRTRKQFLALTIPTIGTMNSPILTGMTALRSNWLVASKKRSNWLD